MDFIVIAGVWLTTLFLGALAGFCAALLSSTEERRDFTQAYLRQAQERCRRNDDA